MTRLVLSYRGSHVMQLLVSISVFTRERGWLAQVLGTLSCFLKYSWRCAKFRAVVGAVAELAFSAYFLHHSASALVSAGLFRLLLRLGLVMQGKLDGLCCDEIYLEFVPLIL